MAAHLSVPAVIRVGGIAQITGCQPAVSHLGEDKMFTSRYELLGKVAVLVVDVVDIPLVYGVGNESQQDYTDARRPGEDVVQHLSHAVSSSPDV
jgi:hypothetical protein